MDVGVGATAKRYYVYFTCKGCDNEWFIEAPDNVDMELIGALKFTCKECNTQTEWLPAHIVLP